MQIIYVLIGISVSVAAMFLMAFIWAVKSGQLEDSETPAIRMLFDENSKPVSTKTK